MNEVGVISNNNEKSEPDKSKTEVNRPEKDLNPLYRLVSMCQNFKRKHLDS